MTHRDKQILLGSVGLAVAIFLLDISMDLGGGGGVPYVLLVLLAMWASRARYLLAAAVTGTLLTLLGFFYFPTDEEFLKIMVNRGESLLALWATALVCLLYKKKKEAYSSLQKNIELVNDNLPALVAYVDTEERYRYTNKGFMDWFGCSSRELQGKSVRELVGEAAYEVIRYPLQEALAGRKVTFESQIPYQFGAKREVLATYVPDLGDEGEVRGVFGLIQDLSPIKETQKELWKEKEKEQKYLNIAGTVIVVLSKEGRVLEINKMGCEILGYPQQEILGKNWFENFLPERDWTRVQSAFQEVMQGRIKPYEQYENPIRTRTGEERLIFWNNALLLDDEGRPDATLSTGHDVTEFRRVDAELKERERQLATLVSNLPGMVYRCRVDRDWTMEYVSDGCLPLTEYQPEEVLLNREVSFGRDLIHPGDQARVWEEVQKALRESRPFELTYRIRTRTGLEKWVWEQGRGVWEENSAVEALEGFITDITQDRRNQDRILQSQKELRSLYHRLESIREEEKLRIAREVHDELGQALTALKLDLSCLEHDLESGEKTWRPRVRSMEKLIEATVLSVQRISTELRPRILDLLGLREAIEWQAQEFEKRTGIRCELLWGEDAIDLDHGSVTTCFRLVQEALTNVARHAGASGVRITLEKDNHHLCLELRDNGRGIEETRLHDSRSLGLIGMRERVQYLGGELHIQGIRGEGTTVRARLPLASSVS